MRKFDAERGKGVKNDRLDALALCQRTDRYTRGNRKAFSIVRVPSGEKVLDRAFTASRSRIAGCVAGDRR